MSESAKLSESDVGWLGRYRAGEVEDSDGRAPEVLFKARRVLGGSEVEPKVMWAVVALMTPEERQRQFEAAFGSETEIRKFLADTERSLEEQLQARCIADVLMVEGEGAHIRRHDDGFRIELGTELDPEERLLAFGHELAHTFFFRFTDGKPEYRGQRPGYSEEVFCELFGHLWIARGQVRTEIEQLLESIGKMRSS